MFILPKIEKITRDATISHFFLMFGYKLFSLYFPLFLVARGFSLPQVGYTYLLIYLPLAIFAPLTGFLNHRINPAILSSLGILGYGFYSLGMILIPAGGPLGIALFYFWQVLLGISAALFFVSSRAILMGKRLENYDRSFGWFYSAPFYADAIAPLVGALVIFKFNFFGVFILSLGIHFLNTIFSFGKLRKRTAPLVDHGFKLKKYSENYRKIFQKISQREMLPILLVSFSILLLAGFYKAFFVLFLKEILSWSQNQILFFISIFSLSFLPVSLIVIRRLEKFQSKKNVFQGSLISGLLTILFGYLGAGLSFLWLFLINIFRTFGNLTVNSARSGFLAKKLKLYPEETGALDTTFAPLGAALGSLIAGLIIGLVGFQSLFIIGGTFVAIISILARVCQKKKIDLQ